MSRRPAPDCEVVVVGGGPVGLLLGCRLAQLGLRFRVLESAPEPGVGSRAIGIHPPSVALLAEVGLLGPFLDEGVRIESAQVFSSRRWLGCVDLTRCDGPFGFVLSLPQERTEHLLDAHLRRLCPRALLRGRTVLHLEPEGEAVVVVARRQDGAIERLRARWVVGCDGRRSRVRASMRVPWVGHASPGTYLMGDFADDTELGQQAAVFVTDKGLVESFPLPSGRRRWVVEADGFRREADAQEIARVVAQRTGHGPRAHSATMRSAFGVEQWRALRLVAGRRILAGDAAHVIHPFGGQGMNLGWLDAWDLARCMQQIHAGADTEVVLRDYDRRRRAVARKAAWRAEMNRRIGRRPRHRRLRNAEAWALLHLPPRRWLAQLFTMQRIGSGSALG